MKDILHTDKVRDTEFCHQPYWVDDLVEFVSFIGVELTDDMLHSIFIP